MRNRTQSRGFTLIELMIVVAIVAILAAIAYPSYQDSVRKSRRADARAVMVEAAQFMERFYTENFRYDQDRGGAAVALPPNLTVSPSGSAAGTQYYNITLTNLAATTFTLNAAPTGAQSGDTGCGTLTVTNTGVKNRSGSKPVEECWR